MCETPIQRGNKNEMAKILWGRITMKKKTKKNREILLSKMGD